MKSKKPKISVNKLGEYIKSSPHRRKTIVRDQKYPKGYVVTRYGSARSAIVDFFVRGRGDKKLIEKTIKSLIQKSYDSNSTFKKQDNELSIKALEIFSKTSFPINLNKHSISKFDSDLNNLLIEGVEVTVQPDIIINGSINGKSFVGAIKVHISKTNNLDPESGKYVAALLHKFLENSSSTKVRPEFCISLDIFTGRYFIAPRSFKSLRKDIEAACYEIRLLWEQL